MQRSTKALQATQPPTPHEFAPYRCIRRLFVHFQVKIYFWAAEIIEKVVWKHCNQFRSKIVVIRLTCSLCGSLYSFNKITAKFQSVWLLEFHFTFQTNLLGEPGVSTNQKKILLTERLRTWLCHNRPQPVVACTAFCDFTLILVPSHNVGPFILFLIAGFVQHRINKWWPNNALQLHGRQSPAAWQTIGPPRFSPVH